MYKYHNKETNQYKSFTNMKKLWRYLCKSMDISYWELKAQINKTGEYKGHMFIVVKEN